MAVTDLHCPKALQFLSAFVGCWPHLAAVTIVAFLGSPFATFIEFLLGNKETELKFVSLIKLFQFQLQFQLQFQF